MTLYIIILIFIRSAVIKTDVIIQCITCTFLRHVFAQRFQNTCVVHRHSYRAQLKCLPAQHNTSTLCHINHCLHFTFPLSSWRRVPTLQCTSFSIFLRMEPTATIKVTMTTNDLTRYWPPEAAGSIPALTQNETVICCPLPC